MGLLITLFLIIVNTYGNTLASSPPNRGFGLIELWMMGTQFPVFFAMLQYGYILHKVKKSHGPSCLVMLKEDNNPLFKRRIGKSPGNDLVMSKSNACSCPDQKFQRTDRNSLVLSILCFATFNVLYWSYVSHIVVKQTL